MERGERRIERVATASRGPAAGPVLDAGGRLLILRLMGLHVHGGGAHFRFGTSEGMPSMSEALAPMETTFFVCTPVLQPTVGDRHLEVAVLCTGTDRGRARLLAPLSREPLS